MIDYVESHFGVLTLFRIYGSAAYKGTLFAALSSVVYLVLAFFGKKHEDLESFSDHELLDHPYPVTVVVTAFMFLLSAKVTSSYNRYWEACTSLHNMHAKWLDVGSTLAAFHMQSKTFEKVQPPSFGDYQHLVDNDLIPQNHHMNRSMQNDDFANETEPKMSNNQTPQTDEGEKKRYSNGRRVFGGIWGRKKGKKTKRTMHNKSTISIQSSSSSPQLLPFPSYEKRRVRNDHSAENHFFNIASSTHTTTTAGCSSPINSPSFKARNNTTTPSLFLQEAAHLVSLLSAVALATLRCEADDDEAPLTEFTPGRHWPNYNSDNDPDMHKYGYKQQHACYKALKYLFDISRTKRERLEYNVARPFPVIGGVSEREAALLQSARGSAAKVSLVYLWVQEFMIREHLHGSLGSVAPPIFSRIPQYLSDGHLWYNSARKMAYIPFPFPHTQITTLFEIVSIFLVPSLMLSKTALWFGFVLNFMTVLLFAGLNELSKVRLVMDMPACPVISVC